MTRTIRPRLEILEDRLAPAGITAYWTGDGSDDKWSNADNWLLNIIPDAGDDIAVFDGAHGPNSSKAAQVDAGFTAAIDELQILSGYAGTITLNTNLSVNDNVDQTGSTVSVSTGKSLSTPRYDLVGGIVSGQGKLQITGMNPFTDALEIAQGILPIKEIEIAPNAGLYIDGAVFTGTTVTMDGFAEWTGGEIGLGSTVTFTNNGYFTITCDQSMQNFGAPSGGLFKNAGSLIKDNTTGVTTIYTKFNNQGAMASTEVSTGTLRLEGENRHTAPFTVNSGAYLEFQASTNWGQGTDFSGNGQVFVRQGGDVIIGSPMPINVYTKLYLIENAKIAGDIELFGSFVWEHGTFHVGTVNAYSYVTLQGTNPHVLGSTTGDGVFNSFGDLQLNDGALQLYQSEFNNYGLFDIRSSVAIGDTSPERGQSSFVNHGEMVKSAGAIANDISPTFTNAGNLVLNGFDLRFHSPMLQTDNNSITDLGGGTIIVLSSSGFQLLAGVLTGGGTITGSLNAAGGNVIVGSNSNHLTFTVTGNYYQAFDAILTICASGSNAWGKLVVTGNTDLDGGSLELSLLNGYNPNQGTVNQEVITCQGTLTVSTSFYDIVPGWSTTYDLQNEKVFLSN